MDPITTLTFIKNVSKDGQDFSVYMGNFDTFLKAEYPTLESENEYYVESDEDDRTIILVCNADRKYAYMIYENGNNCVDILINDLLD